MGAPNPGFARPPKGVQENLGAARRFLVRRWFYVFVLLLLLVPALVASWIWWHQIKAPDRSQPGAVAFGDLVAKGAYLARAGNCMLCHTRTGAEPFAGGRAIETPFGAVYSSNLTPDPATGIGSWTSIDFWRAMHEGRSKDGRLLYPAFPYVNFTQITQDDSDALFAYLRSLSPVVQNNQKHALRWPYDSQLALAGWRTLYFKPAAFQREPDRGAQWNRGAYLVGSLGHCNACHSARNLLGAVDERFDLAGGPMPMKNWYAPSLLLSDEAGLGDWDVTEIVRLLRTGVAASASVTGPMAEVVLHSTQYLSEPDLTAMAVYLRSLSRSAPGANPAPASSRSAPSPEGAALYDKHCADCHGANGEGVAGVYPAMAGNRAVLLRNPANLVQIVLYGGFAPATQGNPRPYGMAPYKLILNDKAVAAVLTHIRNSWGNQAAAVSEFDVTGIRDATAAR